MKLPTEKVENCVSNDDVRAALSHVYLREGKLEATNSYLIVSVAVERNAEDVDGPIPVLAFTLARKFRASHIDLSSADAAVIRTDEVEISIPRPTFEKEPPPLVDLEERAVKGDVVGTVCLDTRFLNKLAGALGTQLRITVRDDETSAVVVTPPGGDNAALVMPIRDRKTVTVKAAKP